MQMMKSTFFSRGQPDYCSDEKFKAKIVPHKLATNVLLFLAVVIAGAWSTLTIWPLASLPLSQLDFSSTSAGNSIAPTTTIHRNITAVIHMGVHKTGSSTIQTDSKQLINELKQDGYEMPWVVKREENTRGISVDMDLLPGQTMHVANHANLASCFLPRSNTERQHAPCDADLLLSGWRIAERKRNLFVTAETFSGMDAEGVDKLAAYLQPWDNVMIVIFYRRFYSYAASLYNQLTKERTWSSSENNQPMWDQTILDFLRDKVIHADRQNFGYTVPVVQRLQKRFHNIVVVNYHDKSFGGLSESFYCHILPNAQHSCDMVRKNPKTTRSNQRTELDYSNLAYGAFKAGLVHIDSQTRLDEVSLACQNFQENVLHLIAADFPRKCLPSETLEQLWNISLLYEQAIFPDASESKSLGEHSLREDFDKNSKMSLCTLDVQATLADLKWQEFFRSLQKQL
jgi:hypothetical protein